MRDVEAELARLGAWRRELGESLMQIPAPCLYEAARTLVERAYIRGEFGEGDRSSEWLESRARDLADVLEGAHTDWQIEACKHG